MNDRQRMLTGDNLRLGSPLDRGHQILITYGHDNPPRRGQVLRRVTMQAGVAGVIGVAVAFLLVFEVVAILLSKR
jgi:hypothetical protein